MALDHLNGIELTEKEYEDLTAARSRYVNALGFLPQFDAVDIIRMTVYRRAVREGFFNDGVVEQPGLRVTVKKALPMQWLNVAYLTLSCGHRIRVPLDDEEALSFVGAETICTQSHK